MMFGTGVRELKLGKFNIRLIDFDYTADGGYIDFYPYRKFKEKIDICLWELESWGNIEFLNFFYECDRADIKVNVICQNNFFPMASIVGHSCISVAAREPSLGDKKGETTYDFNWNSFKRVCGKSGLDCPKHMISFFGDLRTIIFEDDETDSIKLDRLNYHVLNDGQGLDMYNINNFLYEEMNKRGPIERRNVPPMALLVGPNRRSSFVGRKVFTWPSGAKMDTNKLDILKREGIRLCMPRSHARVSELFKFYSSKPIYISEQFFEEFDKIKDSFPKDKLIVEFKSEECIETLRALEDLEKILNPSSRHILNTRRNVTKDLIDKNSGKRMWNAYLSFQLLSCLINGWKYFALSGASSVMQGFYPINSLVFGDIANINTFSALLKKKFNKHFYGIDPLAIKIARNTKVDFPVNFRTHTRGSRGMVSHKKYKSPWEMAEKKIKDDFYS